MAKSRRTPPDVEPGGPSTAQRDAILRTRALRLAARTGKIPEDVVSAERVLLCALGPNLYALPLVAVAKVRPFTRWGAARGHASLVGLVADDGQIRPVIEFAALLGGAPSRSSAGGWLIVLSPPHKASLKVDHMPVAEDVERLPEAPRARVLSGEHRDKLAVLLAVNDLLALAPPSSQLRGAAAP